MAGSDTRRGRLAAAWRDWRAALLMLAATLIWGVTLAEESSVGAEQAEAGRAAQPAVISNQSLNAASAGVPDELPPWEEEPAPRWDASQDPMLEQRAVTEIAVGLPQAPGEALDPQAYAEVEGEITRYFGLPLRQEATLAILTAVKFHLESAPISYVEAERRCHRMVRLGVAAMCRALSPGGGLI